MTKPKKIFSNDGWSFKDLYINQSKFIKSTQLKCGSLPSESDQSHDPWDHIESIMGLNFGHEKQSSILAFDWLFRNQNQDGSWFAKYYKDKPLEKNKPTHFSPYIAVAALHFYKIFNDEKYLHENWGYIKKAINFSMNFQENSGLIPWSIDSNDNIEKDYLLTGSSSILKSFECAIAIGKIVKDTSYVHELEIAHKKLANCLNKPDDLFDLTKDRSHFSMDSYYPVLSGALEPEQISIYVEKVLKNFYVEGIGIRCVKNEPWVTVAETCEFVVALCKANRTNLASKILRDVMNIADENKIPFMGWQYEEKIFWPAFQPNWTAAASIIAADSLFRFSKGSNLFTKNQSDLY
tara:strand:+ start:95 stop:1144 length:1050 start_codon:yes stop_codon:yes gene_type:complete